MSTTFAKVESTFEFEDGLPQKSEVRLTSFYGGDLNGRSMQICVKRGSEVAWLQFTEKDVRKLVHKFNYWLNRGPLSEVK